MWHFRIVTGNKFRKTSGQDIKNESLFCTYLKSSRLYKIWFCLSVNVESIGLGSEDSLLCFQTFTPLDFHEWTNNCCTIVVLSGMFFLLVGEGSFCTTCRVLTWQVNNIYIFWILHTWCLNIILSVFSWCLSLEIYWPIKPFLIAKNVKST